MPSLADINRRIKSVKNTQQITKAMEMVSAAKLRRAQERLEAARPYGHKLTEMLENLAAVAADTNHPLFEKRPVQKRALVVIAGDKGLAGSYNANVIRRAEGFLKSGNDVETHLITVGKRTRDYFTRRSAPILKSYAELGDQVDILKAQTISREIMGYYLSGEVDEIMVLGTRFISAMTRSITLETFLPIEPPVGKAEVTNYIFEPDAASIFANLVPRYVANSLLMSLLESSASEHGARMVAMGAASTNARDMIGRLTLIRNRARQAAITKEISEIVGGAEALS
ncbi:MAG: ATP synthase F1 subunit gamma [Candidatus Eisenbacteria bacterium]|uniref:ATP synthase gamma chain n=1 Tax=Eiseniibacteriota bacterium TaxID=2212470 RepID=A0A7Y2EAX3_UNCEI|nr:ATP synthase F1 subunit gamma [Candidatus Eisenbacteria bacterium]